MSILSKLFNKGASDLVNSVGNAIDKIHTSAEEKELVKHEINKSIHEFEKNIQKQVTERWKADMQSDNKLAKSVRPISLLFLLFILSVFTILDFSFVEYNIKDSYIELWKMLSITAFGAYFGGRSYEKIKNGKQ